MTIMLIIGLYLVGNDWLCSVRIFEIWKFWTLVVGFSGLSLLSFSTFQIRNLNISVLLIMGHPTLLLRTCHHNLHLNRGLIHAMGHCRRSQTTKLVSKINQERSIMKLKMAVQQESQKFRLIHLFNQILDLNNAQLPRI